MNPVEKARSSTLSPADTRSLSGSEGVWVFILADMTVFAVMFGAFMWDRRQNPDAFEQSRHVLNLNFGGINTLILLTSSMLVVLGIDALRNDRLKQAPTCFGLALACGIAFILSKIMEYKEKFDPGYSVLSNDFFMYYFVMTGMHLGHVVVGSVILAVLWRKSTTATSVNGLVAFESGATYWHMVDLLWICLFPLFYLLR